GGGRHILRVARSGFRGLLRKYVVEPGIEALLDLGAATQVTAHPLFLGRLKALAGSGVRRTRRKLLAAEAARLILAGKLALLRCGLARDRRLRAVAGALQQRIPLQFLFNEG